MSKVILHTRLSDIVVHLSWKNKFPCCREEDRDCYSYGFRRLTIANSEKHIFFPATARYFDLVSVTDSWNIKVKERNPPHLLPVHPQHKIVAVKQSYTVTEAGIVEVVTLIFEMNDKMEKLTINIGINSGDFSKSIIER